MGDRDCEHGQLKRSCNICGYEREICELNEKLKAMTDKGSGHIRYTRHIRPDWVEALDAALAKLRAEENQAMLEKAKERFKPKSKG